MSCCRRRWCSPRSTSAGKPLAGRFGSLTLNAFGYLPCAVVAGLLLATSAQGSAIPQASWIAWASIVYMGAGTSVAGYLIYAYALRHLPASRVALLVMGGVYAVEWDAPRSRPR